MQHRLRLLVIPENFPRGPGDIAGIFTHDYVRSVAKDCDVDVLVASPHAPIGLHRTSESVAGEKHWTYSTRLAKANWLPTRFRKLWLLKSLGDCPKGLPKVDVIHAHGPVYFGHAAMRIGRKLGIPTIVTIHTGPFSKLMKHMVVKRLAIQTIENVDCILPVSHDLERQIEGFGLRPKRCLVHHNPVNTDIFKSTPHDRQPVIAWAGRLEDYKGGLLTVKAFHQLAVQYPDWKLEIAGDGPQRPAIEDYIAQHNALKNRVKLLGMLAKEEIATLYARATFGVFPTEHETFGLVLVEAMAAGLPIIGPNCSAPVEYINDENGLMVPPTDVDAIAAAMKNMIVGSARFDREHIRQQAVARFGLASFGTRMQSLYEDLCNRESKVIT